MSTISSPIDTSLVQAAQAQQTASKARDRERAEAERTQRYTDMLDLKVAGVVSDEAARELPRNNSEEADHDRETRKQVVQRDDDKAPHIDVTA
jgi:hypothetical protein